MREAGMLSQAAFLEKFACLGDTCEDTCCRGWDMQLDPPHRELYARQAPELLQAVAENNGALIMKRDPNSGYCVKFEGGLCGIHTQRGTDFLGDACHFYPRITRKFGEQLHRTAALSCPEATRLMLYGDAPFVMREMPTDRLPWSLKEYTPQGLSGAQALAVHEAFMQAAGDETTAPSRVVMRIALAARALEALESASWPQAALFHLRSAEGRMPAAEPKPEDPFNLLHALAGLIAAAPKLPRPRLMEVFAHMEKMLKCSIAWESVGIATSPESWPGWLEARARWTGGAEKALEPVLRRWLQAQLSAASFPFAGFGKTLYERAVILAVRFATLRLALMAHMDTSGMPPTQEQVVKIVQSLSRFMDHLADPQFSLQIYEGAGWKGEARLRGLVEG